jgi:hypothetical protein
MFAANWNNLDMVKVLLDAKAEVNVQDEVSTIHEKNISIHGCDS